MTQRFVKTPKASHCAFEPIVKDVEIDGVINPKYRFKWPPILFQKLLKDLDMRKDCETQITQIMCSLNVLKQIGGASRVEIEKEIEETANQLSDMIDEQFEIYLSSTEGGYKYTYAKELLKCYGTYHALLNQIAKDIEYVLERTLKNEFYETLQTGRGSLFHYFEKNL